MTRTRILAGAEHRPPKYLPTFPSLVHRQDVEDYFEEGPSPLQLLDADGNDVTPRSLVNPGARLKEMNLGPGGKAQAAGLGSFAMKSVTMKSTMLMGGNAKLGSQVTTASQAGDTMAMPFSKSNFQASMGTSMRSQTGAEPVARGGSTVVAGSGISNIKTVHTKQQPLDVPEDELDLQVELEIAETETFWMYDSVGSFTPHDGEDAKAVTENNERYDAYTKKADGSRDWLNDRYSQTLQGRDKDKECQVSAVETSSIACSVTESSIHDTFVELKATEVRANAARSARQRRATESDARGHTRIFPDTMVEIDAGTGKLWSGSVRAEDIPEQEEGAGAAAFAALSELPSFQSSLRFTERLVVRADPDCFQGQNTYCKAYGEEDEADTSAAREDSAEIAAIPEPEPEPEPAVAVAAEDEAEGEGASAKVDVNGPHIKNLWSYSCALTRGRKVTCSAWNKADTDILVAGYGALNAGDKSGVVCCWTFKNPKYPERFYHLPDAACSVAFSQQNPGLLAVGLQNGNILIFDVHTTDAEPICTSQPLDMIHKHVQPVYGLQWVVRQQANSKEKEEIIVSASMGGKVLRWTLARKGLQSTELMTVKRTQSKGSKVVGTKSSHAAFVAMQGSCMSLEFCPDDPVLYLVGTEDGTIHKCSCSYTEQTLKDFYGHSGPVYQIETSPFARDVFLTCSADWTVRLWHHEVEEAIKVLQDAPKSIQDCAWSPHKSTVLAAVGDGGLSIWDLSVKELDPIITLSTQNLGTKLSSVLFSQNSDAIAFGNDDGSISMGMLVNMPKGFDSADQVFNLMKELTKKQNMETPEMSKLRTAKMI